MNQKFGNIVFQNGLVSAIGFIMSIRMHCSNPGLYCIEFSDGSYHNILTFELTIIISAILAVLGYWRATVIYQNERQQRDLEDVPYNEPLL